MEKSQQLSHLFKSHFGDFEKHNFWIHFFNALISDFDPKWLYIDSLNLTVIKVMAKSYFQQSLVAVMTDYLDTSSQVFPISNRKHSDVAPLESPMLAYKTS